MVTSHPAFLNTKGDISLDEPLNVDYEGNELLLSDVLGTDPEIVYKTQEEIEEKKVIDIKEI